MHVLGSERRMDGTLLTASPWLGGHTHVGRKKGKEEERMRDPCAWAGGVRGQAPVEDREGSRAPGE